MTPIIVPIDRHGVEAARYWRNVDLAPWRTPYPLTQEMQEQFYESLATDRHVPMRYWGVEDLDAPFTFLALSQWVAFVGLNPIQWENGCGEISLIVDPAKKGHGIGAAAVALVLAEAFDRLRLLTVHAEVYEHNPALGFWLKMAERWGAMDSLYPRRKFWNGKLHDARIFTFTVEEWRARCATT